MNVAPENDSEQPSARELSERELSERELSEREPSEREHRARRRGRTVGQAVFGTVVILFTLVCSIQIINQTWRSSGPNVAIECHAGLENLVAAVRRARRAAAETKGERAALARFREALQPEWRLRQAVEESCGPDRSAQRALREIDQLRYAEEHAVRYEAVDLARQRRRVMTLEKQLF